MSSENGARETRTSGQTQNMFANTVNIQNGANEIEKWEGSSQKKVCTIVRTFAGQAEEKTGLRDYLTSMMAQQVLSQTHFHYQKSGTVSSKRNLYSRDAQKFG